MKKDCHPLLKGSSPSSTKHRHRFSSLELKSLAAVFQTILPPGFPSLHRSKSASPAASPPFLDQAAEIIEKRGQIEVVILVRLVLLLLATRIGTFLLCGSLCLDEKWPLVRDFSSVSPEKKERVVQKWLRNWLLTPIRIVFIYLKVVCLYVFFSQDSVLKTKIKGQ